MANRAPSSGSLLITPGDVPCKRCRKVHDYRWQAYDSAMGTWADPVDGHAYDRMDASEAVKAEQDSIESELYKFPPGSSSGDARYALGWDDAILGVFAVIDRRRKKVDRVTVSPLRCVKCGSTDIHTRWEPSILSCGWDLADMRRGREAEFSGEHMHRHCRVCSYEWGDKPLESKETK